ncbi:nucleic acid dioxygenase ALKBH1 isoform 2-T2 [Mantella aurantiaca]
MAAAVEGEEAFRRIFRLYRRSPEAGGTVHFRPGERGVKCAQLTVGALSNQDAGRVGLQPPEQWKAYHLEGYPGFLFITNPFLPGWQHRWVRQCLKSYPRKPNVCNLDLHMSPERTANLWSISEKQLRNKMAQKHYEKTLLEKLRWVTLGFHYNWETKKYYKEKFTPFPADLAKLSRCVALACGFSNFKAEAAILNYYHMDSSLGIHVDEAELDHQSPLLSFSFGQSSIFLLGGQSREVAPTAMMMNSGDIMIMAGASRLLYHAVPRILRHPGGGGVLPPDLSGPPGAGEGDLAPLTEPCSPQDWEVCAAYLQDSRINVTVRQVLQEGGAFPMGAETDHVTPGEAYHSQEIPETELQIKRVKTTSDSSG